MEDISCEDSIIPKKILIICGHPDPAEERFCRLLARAYAEGAEGAGHAVRQIDVASLAFSFLRTKTDFETGKPSESISQCQQDILWAEHIVFVFPLWLGALPALLKGFLEQVFRPSFAFGGDSGKGRWTRLLSGRSARVVVTMGMPALFYRWYYGAHGVRGFEQNILNFSGISPIRETLIGMVEADPAKGKVLLEKLRRLGSAGA